MSTLAPSTSIPVEVMRSAWQDLWDELLHASDEDAPPVEEARPGEIGEGQAPLQREADEAA